MNQEELFAKVMKGDNADTESPEPPKEAAVAIARMPLPLVKGVPVFICRNQTAAILLDTIVDMVNWNGAHIEVWVTGTSPSANIAVRGAGSDGNFKPLPDPQAYQNGVAADLVFDVMCNADQLKVELTSISGTYTAAQGYTIRVTPCLMAGPSGSGFNYVAYSTAQTATVIKSGPGILHSVTILGGTAGAITVWDALVGSGTTILPAFTPANVNVPVTLIFDVAFATGLTVTTAANTVIVFAYR